MNISQSFKPKYINK